MKRKLRSENNCLNNKINKICFGDTLFNLIESIYRLNQEFKMAFLRLAN